MIYLCGCDISNIHFVLSLLILKILIIIILTVQYHIYSVMIGLCGSHWLGSKVLRFSVLNSGTRKLCLVQPELLSK